MDEIKIEEVSQSSKENSPTIKKPEESEQRKSSKQKIYLVVAAILFLALAGLGAALYFVIFDSDKDSTGETTATSSSTATASTMTPETTTTTTSAKSKPVSIDKSLQEVVTASCEKFSFNVGGYTYYIKVENFPFTVDASKITVLDNSLESEYQGVCGVLEENPGTADITFNYKLSVGDKNRAYVFDEDTVELGHGGAPFFGDFGELIEEGDDYLISTYLTCGDICYGTVDEYSLHLRVKKILEYEDGYKLYLNTTFTIEDSDFEDYLSANMKMIDGKMMVDYEKAEAGLVGKFFKDIDNLGNAEEEAYDKAMEFVRAIGYEQ
jgi:hypothetical protein